MAVTLVNYTQNYGQTVSVVALPIANPEDLIFAKSSESTIFPNIQQDLVNPPLLYHGGNPIIPPDVLQIFGCDIVSTTVTPREVISDYRQKGILENRDVYFGITNVTNGVDPTVTIGATLPYITGAKVRLTIYGLTECTSANTTAIATITGINTFTLEGVDTSSDAVYISGGVMLLQQYFWDEVYTTPIGLFQAVADGTVLDSALFYQLAFSGDDSETIKLDVQDPNIIPKVGDTILLQKFFDSLYTFTNGVQGTTDGQNNVPFYHRTETQSFKVLGVAIVPNAVPAYNVVTLTLDKSFKPDLLGPDLLSPAKYMVVLLNRDGTGINKELYPDTWQPHEVHRQQLLGDPYDFSGVTQPRGRKNYLYYRGAEDLGLQQLLAGILDPLKKTPIIVFDFDDDIKDRIYKNEIVELHLPSLLIQGEDVLTILESDGTTITDDLFGCGNYSPLKLRDANDTTIRYGWVFFDLRIIVIDHPELATAFGWNSKRNYTLPTPVLSLVGNNLQNSNPNNPLLITGATNTLPGTPIKITTGIIAHNILEDSIVVISGVLGNTNANGTFYAHVTPGLSSNELELYAAPGMVGPVSGNGTYLSGGTLVGTKLPYEYFITYRLNGINYDTIHYSEPLPFNFTNLATGAIDNVAGTVQLDIPTLTHLVDINVLEGFEAETVEVIIGKYIPTLTDPYTVGDWEEVVTMLLAPPTGQNDLLDGLGAQNIAHSLVYTKAEYDTQVVNIATEEYDFVNIQKMFNITPVPDTLLTGEGDWLVGFIKHKEQVEQYRLTLTFTVPADKWNGTTNPSFVPGDPLMTSKLISELAFLIHDVNGNTVEQPYIYGKISPPLVKTNTSAILISVEVDF